MIEHLSPEKKDENDNMAKNLLHEMKYENDKRAKNISPLRCADENNRLYVISLILLTN